jgi:hypothetical protein
MSTHSAVEGEWWLWEEPPAHVTRVRSDDMRDIAIRGREDPSLWAWVRVDGTARIPPDGMTREQSLRWEPWLDLNLMAVMYDGTASDQRARP